MKMTKILTISIMFLLLIVGSVAAATYTNVGPAAGNYELDKFYDKDGNPVTVDGYLRECTDDNCDAPANGYYYTNTDDELLYTYPYSDTPKDYAAYAFAEGYAPKQWTRTDNWNPGGEDAYLGTYEHTMNKIEGCRAPLTSFSLNYYDEVNRQVEVGQPITVSVKTMIEGDIVSAFVHNGQPPFMVPAEYEDWYDADTEVNLKVYDPEGDIVYDETKTLHIMANSEEQVEFTGWTPSEVGTGYTAVVETSIVDEMCESTTTETWTDDFAVVDPVSELCFTNMQNMEFSDDFPKVGEELTITFERLSNYRDNVLNRYSIGTEVAVDITKDGQSIDGFPQTAGYEATGDIDALESASVSIVPTEAGEYLVTLTGTGDDGRCNGISNEPRAISQTKYIYEQPSHDLTITVEDADTFTAIEGVDVQLTGDGYDQTLTTDGEGAITFTGLSYGDYMYEAEHSSYTANTGNIAMGNGDATYKIFMDHVNYLPTINELPGVSISRRKYSDIDLDDYVQDNDDADSTLAWSIESIYGSRIVEYSVDPETHVLSLTGVEVGADVLTLTVTDPKGGQDSANMRVEVTPTDLGPSISGLPDVTVYEDTQEKGIINLENYAEDREESSDQLSYEIVSGDTSETCGVTISEHNMIDIDPAADYIGTCDVTVKVTDSGDIYDSDTFRVTVMNINDAPVIGSVPVTEVQPNSSYVYSVEAFDADFDVLTFSLVAKPSGMAIERQDDTRATVRWDTPEEEGSHTVLVAVNDGSGGTDTQQFTLDVTTGAGNNPPVITSEPVTEASVNADYVYDVEAEDADNDTLTYSLTAFPAGMTIDADTGLIGWTPAAAGEYDVTVAVNDGSGGTDVQPFKITVDGGSGNNPPVITSDPITEAEIDVEYEYDVEATDADGDTLTYSLADAPAGMDIDEDTGLIEWIPSASGDYDVDVVVGDGNGGWDVQEFTICVSEDINRAPYFTSSPVTTALVKEDYSYNADAVDPDGDEITYSLEKGPEGMTINPSNGDVSWLPDYRDKGTNEVVIKASDGIGGEVTQNFSIAVTEFEDIPGRDNLMMAGLRVVSGDYIKGGDTLVLAVSLKNTAEEDLENVKVTASIPQMGIVRSVGPFDLEDDEDASKRIYMDIPSDENSGKYAIRISVSNDKLRRVKYRDFKIE
ncbi:hypothetical protein GF336_05105 [Candidatus Woesearchaeota archaeon]|nr:hypothetical protein [Candidatus Woesearchaeota archaeon]